MITITEFYQLGTLGVSIATLVLLWRHAIPVIKEIKTETAEQTVKISKIEDQTNGLTQKVEIAAKVEGIVEGRKQAAEELGAHIEAVKESLS